MAKSSLSLPPLEVDEQLVFDWLRSNVFSDKDAYSKRKLIVQDKLITAIQQDSKALGIPPTFAYTTYSTFSKGAATFIYDPTVIFNWIDKLVDKKRLLVSGYPEPIKSVKSVFVNGSSGYISCLLLGETVAEHKARHQKLFIARVAKLEINQKVKRVVANEKQVKVLEEVIRNLELAVIRAESVEFYKIATLNKKIKAEAKKGDKPLLEGIQKLTGLIREVDLAVAARKQAILDVKAKKAELNLLKNKLKKPVRGLVSNPEAMNL